MNIGPVGPMLFHADRPNRQTDGWTDGWTDRQTD